MIRVILVLITLTTLLSAQINNKTTYVINKKPVQVIHFIDSINYLVIEYTKNKKYLVPTEVADSGKYKVGKLFIEFKSKDPIPILKGKKLFINNRLSQNWWNPNKVYTKSDTNKYHSFFWIPSSEHYVRPKPTVSRLFAGEYAKQFFINNIHKYAPEYDSLLYKNYCGPGMYKTYIGGKHVEWIGDTTFLHLINDYETVVHESTHGFNVSIGYLNKKWREKIMVEPGITIFYDDTRTFTSAQFSVIVPSDASKKIFRYNSYVGYSSTVSANLSGIYGLIDEFSAYRNGCHASLVSTLKAIELKQDKHRDYFFEQSCGTYFAYYEFRLFIAWFLDYGEKYQNPIWKEIMNNKNLRIAFTLIDDLFLEDIKLIKQLQDKLKYYGYDYYERTYVDYLRQLIPNWQHNIDDFKIKGVNKLNWKEMVEKLPPLDKNSIIYYKNQR